MRVLVTGATGFVGGAVVRRLRAAGHDVRALVRSPSSRGAAEALGAEPHAGSVADPNEVAAAARGCDAVVHAAAVASHRAAPRALAWVNVAGTENVLLAARHAEVRTLVVVSCADVTLGDRDRVHRGEDEYLEAPPYDPHARTKRLAEELVLAASGPELAVVALRPAWLWGPGDTTNLPWIARWAGTRGLALPGGGGNLFDTTHVAHLAEAVQRSLDAPRAAGRAIHVADNLFLTAAEFFGRLSRAVGLPPPRRGLPYPVALAAAHVARSLGRGEPWPSDVVHLGRSTQLDQGRAIERLGLEPGLDVDLAMDELAAWAREVGGPGAIARLGRDPATADSVDAQARAAGA